MAHNNADWQARLGLQMQQQEQQLQQQRILQQLNQPSFGHDNSTRSRRMDRALALADSLHPRIQKLGLVEWQQQVYGLIFFHAYQSPSMANAVDATVFQLLGKLEKLEATSLLKLAVWKSQCLMQPTKELKTYPDFLYWSKGGWKQAKATYESHPAPDIIAQCVGPFL